MSDGRVLDKPVDHATWGPLRALYEWLKPAATPAVQTSAQMEWRASIDPA